MSAADDTELLAALELSRRFGMLGERSISEVVDHANAFVDALSSLPTGSLVIDLGSGGGIPGLVIARRRPDLQLLLVDRRATRVDHLRRLITRLALRSSTTAVTADAAALPRQFRSDLPAAAVVARGFGSPDLLLRAAAPLLDQDGLLVVSEPPAGLAQRWTTELLSRTGFVREQCDDGRVAVLRRTAPR